MKYSVDEVMQYIEEEDVRFIRLAICDAYGIQKNLSVTPGEVRKAFERGAPFNAKNIAGFGDSPYGTLYLKPDPETMAILPWRPDSGRVLRMFCNVFTPAGEPYAADARAILMKAEKKARDAGTDFRFGTESEFYLFLKDDAGHPTKMPYDEAGYMDIAPLDRCENVRREISLTIERMGMTPERSHHEKGPGQNEISFHYASPLKAADQMITFRMVVSTIADQYGLVSDFFPKPLPDQPGNGYHINLYAADRDGRDIVRMAAAGILEKIREMTIFLNPTDDSYSRLGNHTAPDRVAWAGDGDSALMHIEPFMGRTKAALRSPDAACNPYLAYALLIHAGLLGIERGLDLPEKNGQEGQMLPGSLEEAASLARESGFIREIIPEGILKAYQVIHN